MLPQFCVEEGSTTEAASGLSPKSLRLLRLLRLSKLTRLVRGSRVLRRIQAHSGVSTGMQSIIEILVMVILSAHWIASFLVLQVTALLPSSHT